MRTPEHMFGCAVRVPTTTRVANTWHRSAAVLGVGATVEGLMNSHLGTLLAAWWADRPTSWLVGFLESRDVLHWIRRVIAVGGLALAGVQAATLCDPSGPHSSVTRLAALVIVTLGIVWGLRWLLAPWPTPGRSLALAAAANVAITVSCWLDTVPLTGLTGTVAFLMPGSYLAFFHGPKAQAVHVCWALLSISSLAVRVGLAGPLDCGWVLAAARALLVVMVVVAILPVQQLGFWLVHRNAADALIDPLTGLANRRGLEHRVGQLARTDRTQGTVCVFAIDLDRFKTINDLYGHPVGDNVIIQTAGCIRDVLGSEAIIARIGGEEFIAVDLLESSSAHQLADRIRDVIADATSPPVTASVGVAVTTSSELPVPREIGIIIECADGAMYEAKHSGGDTTRVLPCIAYAEALNARKPPRSTARSEPYTSRAFRLRHPLDITAPVHPFSGTEPSARIQRRGQPTPR